MTAQSRTRYFSRPVFTPLAVLLWMLLCVGPARPAPLVTDLSDHLISITSSYTGTDLLLFGAIDLPEDQIFSPETRGDVVVVVRGPGQDMVVRRKEAEAPSVVACTLLPFETRFELGGTLTEAAGPVQLNHPHCARFCVLGGGSCSG